MSSLALLSLDTDVDSLLQRLQYSVDCSEHDMVDWLLDSIEGHPVADAIALSRARSAASLSLYRRNRFEDAARTASMALGPHQRGLDSLSKAEALVAWARIEWAVGDLPDALTMLEDAAHLALHDNRLDVYLNTLLGLVHADLGRAETAENYHRTALRAARECGVLDLQIIAFTNLAGRLLCMGRACAKAGQEQTAAAAWTELDSLVAEADGLAVKYKQEMTLPHILVAHAASLACRSEFDRAELVFERQSRLVQAYADKSSAPYAALERGRMYRARGLFARARAEFESGVLDARELNVTARQADLVRELASLEENAKQYKAALMHLKCWIDLREAVAMERAQRKASALALRLQTGQALRDAAEQRRRVVKLTADNQWLQDRAESLAKAAYLDPLTGLGNRRFIDEHLPKLHARCLARGQPMAVAFLDADHFKQVNDRFSHAVGDAVLKTLGSQLQTHCRGEDLCARFGGEEFIIALADADLSAAEVACERLRAAVERWDWPSIASELRVTVSIGVALITEVATLPELIVLADQRVYSAKAAGRNRVCTR
jgi:diguanylate cyclase (GGDEF)-like protein